MSHYIDKERVSEDRLQKYRSTSGGECCKEHSKHIANTFDQMDSLDRNTWAISDRLAAQESKLEEVL